MNRAMGHQSHSNAATQHCNNPLSIFMSNLLSNSSNSKIEIVSDNAKKRAFHCKIQRQSSRISIRRNQRWKCLGSNNGGGNIKAPPSSCFSKLSMNDLPQRRKSIERIRESVDSSEEYSWEFSDDFDDDGISSTVSLDDSYRSCDGSLGTKNKVQHHPPAVKPSLLSPVPTTVDQQQQYGSPTTTKRK